MRNNSSLSELLLTDTAIPDIFIVQYMASLSKDALCLYMWLKMNCGVSLTVTESDIESYGLLSKADAGRAIAELITRGLLVKQSDDKLILEDLRKKEVDSYIRRRTGIAVDGEYQGGLSESGERDILAGSISKTFFQGRMPYVYFKLIDTCMYEYKFESSVIYRLFEEGRELKIHLKPDDMTNLASSWFNMGYTTVEALKVYFDNKKKCDEIVSLMGKLTRRRLNDLDITRIRGWVKDFNVTASLVEYAFKVNEFRGNITAKNVEDKLREWYAADISTIDAAVVYENERHTENRNKASRKRASNNLWKTGSEAGITADSGSSDKNIKEKNVQAPDASTADSGSDVVEIDPILAMFGDDDEDN